MLRCSSRSSSSLRFQNNPVAPGWKVPEQQEEKSKGRVGQPCLIWEDADQVFSSGRHLLVPAAYDPPLVGVSDS